MWNKLNIESHGTSGRTPRRANFAWRLTLLSLGPVSGHGQDREATPAVVNPTRNNSKREKSARRAKMDEGFHSPRRLAFVLMAAWGLLSWFPAPAFAAPPYLHAPSVETYAKHDPDGLTILSNGRYLKPAGRHLPVARFPYGLAMSRDGNTLFVASDGVGQIITGWQTAKPEVALIYPPTYQRPGGERGKPTNAGGVDFSPDGRTLYWSSGETGAIYLFDVASRQKLAEVSLNTEVGGCKYDAAMPWM